MLASVMNELIGAAAVAVVAWFAAGTIYNVRTGRRMMRWMHDGLRLLGSRTTVRWLGSTVLELAVRDARAPFESAVVVVFLEARDLPWMWAIGRRAGRRDVLIVRGVLRHPPAAEFEVLKHATWSGRDALRRVPGHWLLRDGGNGIALHYADAAALPRAEALLQAIRSAGLDVHRVSARRTEPHFQLHAALPRGDESAQRFFETVRELVERTLA